MLIRKWVELDNFAISKLEEVCFEYPWNEEMIAQTFTSPNFYGLVAEDNCQVIGYVGAIYCMDQADVALVAVHPNFRRKKIAESMINQLIEQLSRLGVNMFYLEVRVSNYPARRLYEKIGFNQVGIRKNYYENAEDAIVMARLI